MQRSFTTIFVTAALASGMTLGAGRATAQAHDIGFARAEQIALGQVKGSVEEIAKKTRQGRALFEVDVRTPEGVQFEVRIDAQDGHVLEV